MVTPIDSENKLEMVPCKLCSNQVWIRKDRLQNHIAKVHSPTAAPRKSFTTYKARIASTFPPKVIAKPTIAPKTSLSNASKNITLTSRSGQRAGKGICAECGLEQLVVWHYAESNQGPVDICNECKQIVFARSFS